VREIVTAGAVCWRAILDRVEAELRQTDEDERGRVLILTYEALGLPRE
jgi:hypothetical protein